MIQFESIGVPPPYLDENNLGAFQSSQPYLDIDNSK